jgi:hypothetical protein
VVEIAEVYGRRAAHEVIERSRADYQELFPDIARLAQTIAWRGEIDQTPKGVA